MIDKSQHIIYVFLVLLGAGFMGWYYAGPAKPVNLSEQELTTRPDAIIDRIQLIKYDKSGKPIQQLSAKRLVHVPEGDTSYFTSPIAIVQQEQQAPWHISAKHARADKGSEVLTLTDDVRLQQQHGQKLTTINTQLLRYYPEKRLAKTDQTITLQQPGVNIRSQGMTAYLDQERVLLTKARGYYDPKQADS